MAIELATAYVSIVPSTRGIKKGLEREFAGVDQVAGASGQKAGRSFASRALGAVTKVAAVGGGIAGALFSGKAISAGLDRLTTIEDATVSLTTIMGDASKAGKLMDDVLEVVRGTPFNLDQFASAGKNLVAFGVEAKKVPGVLTAIGEAAAASGKGAEGVDRMVDAFGKIAASGQVSLDQVWSISDAGVNALAILANGFGVTTEEMKKMISKGAVPAEKALDLLSKGIVEGSSGVAGETVALGGAMEALRQTFTGALGGLGAAVARFGASALKPFMGDMTTGMTSLADIIDTFGEKVGAAMQSLADSPAWGRVRDTITDLPDRLSKLMSGLSQLRSGDMAGAGVDFGLSLGFEEDEAGTSRIIGFLETVQRIGKAVAPVFTEIGSAVGSFLSAAADSGLEVFSTLFEGLAPVASSLLPTILELVTAFSPFRVLLDALTPILPQVADALGQVASTVGQLLGEALEAAAPLLATITDAFSELLSRGLSSIIPAVVALVPPVLELVTALAGPLGDALAAVLPPVIEVASVLGGVLIQAVRTIVPFIEQFAGLIGDVLGNTIVALTPILAELAGLLGEVLVTALEALSPLLGAVGPVVGVIGTVFASLAPVLVEVVRVALELIQAVLRPLLPVLPILAEAAGSLVTAFVDILAALVPLLPPLLELAIMLVETIGVPVITAVATALAAVAQAIAAIVTPVADLLASGIGQLAEIIGALFAGDFSTAADLFGDLVGKALSSLGGLLSAIGGWITGTALPFLTEKFPEWIGALVGWITDVVPQIPGKLFNVWLAIQRWIFTEAIPKVASAAVELGGALLGWVATFVPQIPGKLLRIATAIGSWILTKAVPTVAEKAVKFTGAFLGWIVTTVRDLPGKLLDIANRIGTWILMDAVPTVAEKAKELIGAVTGWVADAVKAIPGKLSELADKILEFIKGLPKKIGDAAKGMWDGITGAFKTVVNALARAWNNTIGKLKFQVPDVWGLPMRGQTIQFPQMPLLEMHTGGTVDGRLSGDEVVRKLLRSETVLTAEQMGQLGAAFGSQRGLADELRSLRAALVENQAPINVYEAQSPRATADEIVRRRARRSRQLAGV